MIKKYLFSILLIFIILSSFMLTSCSSDDEERLVPTLDQVNALNKNLDSGGKLSLLINRTSSENNSNTSSNTNQSID